MTEPTAPTRLWLRHEGSSRPLRTGDDNAIAALADDLAQRHPITPTDHDRAQTARQWMSSLADVGTTSSYSTDSAP